MTFFPAALSLVLALLAVPAGALAERISLSFVGDVMLAGSATDTLQRYGYSYPFAATAAELRRSDLVVGNLEAPPHRGGDASSAPNVSASRLLPLRQRP